MPWWWQPHPSPCGGAARGSSTNAARPAIPHSPAVLAGGTGLVGSEVCKRPASSAKVRAESHQASSNASSGGVSLTAVCDLTFGAVRGTTIRRTCGPRAASGTSLATGTTTSGFVVLGMWSGTRASLPHAGTGAVTAASRVRSSLPDRAPDAAVSAAASNTKAPPGPVVAKSEAGPSSETGSAEKNSSGFAAKGKRGEESREHFASTTKPEVADPDAGQAPGAERGPQERRIDVPRTAPKDASCLRVIVPVGNPLRDITRQVRYPVGRRTSRKKPDRAGTPKPCLIVVRPVGIGLLVAPRILAPLRAPRGPFPFCLCRQPHARPIAVRFRVEPGYIHDRTIGP